MRATNSWLARYGVAAGAFGLTMLGWAAWSPPWGSKNPLIAFFPAILASAWFGGVGPGLLAALGAMTAAHSWNPLIDSVGVADPATLLTWAVYLLLAGMVSGLVAGLHRASRAVAASAAECRRLAAREQAARAEAEAANHAKDEFLAVLSHELRTPLTAMVGWLRLLRTGQLDQARIEHALETVERNAKMEARLVNDLLAASSIIAGKLEIEREPVALAEVINDTVDSMRFDAEAKAIRLDIDVGPAPRPVLGDRVRLQQIVGNLVSNAVKFTPEGGVVRVMLSRHGDRARLAVSDTGIGIEPEALPHIFDRFRQANRATTTRYGGLGLGLAIVRHLVDLHGGTVQASSPGVAGGATVVVELPLALRSRPDALAEDHEAGTPRGVGKAPRSRTTTLDGQRVLVVDDEPSICALVTTVLQARKAEVLTVGSVADALAAIGRFSPHVVITDLVMPGADGFELLRRVRAAERSDGGATLPVIALTGHGSEADRVRVKRAGFHAHLAKPVEPDLLVATVGKAVGLRSL